MSLSDGRHARAEAKRCRELASQSVAGSIMADRWRTIAAEYETLADALVRGNAPTAYAAATAEGDRRPQVDA